jgi:hypothetical protein
VKRAPQNNGMKLTARGASVEARQLIPVLGGPRGAWDLVEDEPTTFLNVDLDIASRVSLEPLVKAFGAKVFVHHVGKSKGKYWARVSRSSYRQTVDKLTQELCALVKALPTGARKLWDEALSREFNIGIQAGLWPHSAEIRIREGTVALVALLGGTIAITTYAPVLEAGETVGMRSKPRNRRPPNNEMQLTRSAKARRRGPRS